MPSINLPQQRIDAVFDAFDDVCRVGEILHPDSSMCFYCNDSLADWYLARAEQLPDEDAAGNQETPCDA